MNRQSWSLVKFSFDHRKIKTTLLVVPIILPLGLDTALEFLKSHDSSFIRGSCPLQNEVKDNLVISLNLSGELSLLFFQSHSLASWKVFLLKEIDTFSLLRYYPIFFRIILPSNFTSMLEESGSSYTKDS